MKFHTFDKQDTEEKLRQTQGVSVGISFFLFFPSKIGEEQSAEDAEDGPSELLVSDVPKSVLTVSV